MNRITAVAIAALIILSMAVLPLVYVAVTGDFSAGVRTVTGFEEDSAVIDYIFTARQAIIG